MKGRGGNVQQRLLLGEQTQTSQTRALVLCRGSRCTCRSVTAMTAESRPPPPPPRLFSQWHGVGGGGLPCRVHLKWLLGGPGACRQVRGYNNWASLHHANLLPHPLKSSPPNTHTHIHTHTHTHTHTHDLTLLCSCQGHRSLPDPLTH